MRALVLGLVVAVSGCSTPPPPCSPSNCTGCCDASGACAAGNSLTQCGAFGAVCQSCPAAHSCELGQCRLSGGGGGGGATGGGGGATGGGGGATGGGGGGGATGGGGGGATGGGGGGTGGGGGATGGGGGATGGGGGATGGGGGGPCQNDFDCPAGDVCDPLGTCGPGPSCTASSQCQSLVFEDRCYRYGRQCTCDLGTCRVRKGPCELCLTDAECGSDVVIFGPPDGAGAGRCVALLGDTSGRKYCSYQRVGTCTCGTIDDGTGYCRPQSNSCSVIGCMSDLQCPRSLTCDGTGGACGTCVADVCAAPNPVPVAQLSECEPSQLVNDPDCVLGPATASFNLSAISPDVITLSGVTSTDDTTVTDFRFTLLTPIPGGATTAALANHNTRGTQNKTTLTIPTGVTGTFRVGLEVWDNCGQKSATTHVATVIIYP